MRNFFRKYFNGFLVIFIAIFSFTVLGTEQIEAKTEEVKIGVALALSGQSAHAGHAIVQGLKLAVDQYTEKGGFEVAGKKYVPELLINDTGGSPANGVAQAEKLVNKYNAKVIFGCTLSHVAIPMLGVTQPAKVIHVSSCTGWEKHIGRPGNDYMFKLIGPQADAARSYIPAAVKRWNIKTVVQIMVNDDPGRMYAEVYGKAAERNGVKVLETFFYDPKLEEFYPVLTKIKTMNPDTIWMGAFNDPFAVVVRQSRELGMKVTFVGLGTGITGVAGNLPGGERVEGFTFCSFFDPNSKNPEQIALMERFEKTFKSKVTSDFNYLLWHNEALHMIIGAMQRAGTVTDTTKIMSFIRGQTYKGRYGYTWQIDKMGLNHYGYYMGEIKGGKDVFTFIPLVTEN